MNLIDKYANKSTDLGEMSLEEMAEEVCEFVFCQGGDGDCVVFARTRTKEEIADAIMKVYSWSRKKEGDRIVLWDSQEFIVIEDESNTDDHPSWISGYFIY